MDKRYYFDADGATTEADQSTTSPLALLATAMDTTTAAWNTASKNREHYIAVERSAFTAMNDARRAFNDAVNAMKVKRPKKAKDPAPATA